jgi:hypothetical protein
MIGWTAITRLGDVSVTAPAALAIGILLLHNGERRSAIRWVALFTGGTALVAATKIAFIGWGIGISPLDFTGASGHAMRAAAIAPVIPYLFCRQAPRLSRLAWMVLACMSVASVGISRIMLHAHSVSEVVAGWVIGLIVVSCFIRLSDERREPPWNSMRVAAGMAVLLAAAFLAKPAPTQQWLIQASLYLSGREKPVLRPASETVRTCSQVASAFSSNWCRATKSGSPT